MPNEKKQPKNHYPLWVFAVARKTDLTVSEVKTLMLLNHLSDGTNCVNQSLDDFKAEGVYSTNKQEDLLGKLHDKNMVLPNLPDTTQVIIKTICPHCPLKNGSRECVNRKGTLFINRNHKTWKGTKLNLNKTHASQMLEKNHKPLSFDGEGPTLNQRINAQAKEVVNKDRSLESLRQDIREHLNGNKGL